MKIGFIGAGRVGTAFGIYLKNNGFDILGYYSRSFSSAQRAATLTSSTPFDNLKEMTKKVDLLFITTNDNEIAPVGNRLVSEGLLKEGSLVIHMSGAASSKILESVKERGCFPYSLHPLQAFADVEKAIKNLENTVFSIEGDPEKVHVLEGILKDTKNQYFKIKPEQKELYHAGACIVSNYLVTLMDYGLSLYENIGIEKDLAFKALYPLITGTVNNIYEMGIDQALTGPISRGDTDTITKHIKVFQEMKPDTLRLYKELGLKTVELATREKLKDPNKIAELQNILKEV